MTRVLLACAAAALIVMGAGPLVPSPAAAGASDVVVRAEAVPNPVGLDDRVTLRVVVSGGQGASAELATIDGLDRLAGPNRSSQVQATMDGTGFHQVVTETLTWAFLPRREGEITIPSIVVEVGDTKRTTAPIRLTVVPGSVGGGDSRGDDAARVFGGARSREPAPDVRIVRRLSKTRSYLGEPVQLSTELWFGASRAQPGLPQVVDDSERAGFWVEKREVDPNAGHRTERDGDRVFDVFPLRLETLYPTDVGTHTLGPERWRVPYTYGGGFFAERAEAFPRVEAVGVEVLPLPESGRPEGYAGLVGDFTARAEVDRARGKVGEALTWTIRLEGTGNFRTAGPLPAPPLEGAQVFSTKARDAVELGPDGLTGSRVLELVVIPERPGPLRLPAVAAGYFETRTGRYAQARTEPIAVEVEPGSVATLAVAEGAATSAAAPARRPREQAVDIRYLVAEHGSLAPYQPFRGTVRFWAWALVPPLVNVGLGARRVWRDHLDADPVRRRRKEALARLARAVERLAPSQGGATAEPWSELGAAWLTFLGDRFGIAAVDLTGARLRGGAAARGLPSEHVEDVIAILRGLDQRRFGGGGGDVAQEAARMLDLARRLDRLGGAR